MKKNQKEIEKIEYDIMEQLNYVFHNSIDDFNTKLDNSKKYLEYITLPMLIASLEDKSYNPFSEIIEKYVEYIMIQKMEKMNYKYLPLGYSSDLCFESKNSVIHIDIKTANINNPSDFKGTIPLGFNQTSYPAKLPLGNSKSGYYDSDGIEPFKVYSNLPTYYKISGEYKFTITNALLFIYPEYKDVIDSYREDLKDIMQLIDDKLFNTLKTLLNNDGSSSIKDKSIDDFLEHKPTKSRNKRRQDLTNNIIRGIYIQNRLDTIFTNFDFSENEKQNLNLFFDKIKTATQKLRDRNISPIAIVSISIPNGELAPHYNTDIVSGKSYGKSIRFHYDKGIFKLLSNDTKKIPRVVFLNYRKEYINELKRYFKEIYQFEINIKQVEED